MISITQVEGATTYRIEKRAAHEAEFTLVTNSAQGCAHRITGLATGVEHVISIKAGVDKLFQNDRYPHAPSFQLLTPHCAFVARGT